MPRAFHFLRRHFASALFALCVLAFLWLPIGQFFGAALREVFVQPALLQFAIPFAPLQRALFFNTVVLAIATALGALVIGVPVGIALVRGARKVRPTLGVLCALPLALPPMMLATAWLEISRTPPARSMASYAATNAAQTSPLWRSSLVLALCFFPVVAFALRAALLAIPRDLQDAARLHQSEWGVWRRLVLPLVAPALWGAAGIVAVLAMWEMGAPDLLDARTYSVEIYRSLGADDALGERGKNVRAALASLPMMALGALALWPAMRALRLQNRRGVALAPDAVSGGQSDFRGVTIIAILLLAISPLAPLVVFANQLRPMGVLWQTWDANLAEIINTIVVATSAATLMTFVALMLVAAWRDWPTRARELATKLFVAPLSVSPILMGLALIGFYNRPFFALLYGGIAPTGQPVVDFLGDAATRWGMEIIGDAMRFLPLAILLTGEAARRIEPALIDAARGLGVSSLRAADTILAPLLAPALAGTWALLWALCGAELATTVLVQQPGGQPLTVPIFGLMHIFALAPVAALCLTLCALSGAAFGVAALVSKRWLR